MDSDEDLYAAVNKFKSAFEGFVSGQKHENELRREIAMLNESLLSLQKENELIKVHLRQTQQFQESLNLKIFDALDTLAKAQQKIVSMQSDKEIERNVQQEVNDLTACLDAQKQINETLIKSMKSRQPSSPPSWTMRDKLEQIDFDIETLKRDRLSLKNCMWAMMFDDNFLENIAEMVSNKLNQQNPTAVVNRDTEKQEENKGAQKVWLPPRPPFPPPNHPNEEKPE